jgi:parallel beta-helix repeat protein
MNGFAPLESAHYNTDIVIENNVMENCAVGISIRNASNVRISCNEMRNVVTEVLIADSTTNMGEY